MINSTNLKKRASSLVEAMLVIGIISTSLIGATALIIRSLTTIKQNEIDDSANGIMVQGLEITKSPGKVYVETNLLNNASIGQTYYFSLAKAASNNLYLKLESPAVLSTCSENSSYNANNININSNTTSTPICIQLEIKIVADLKGSAAYQIKSRVVYNNAGDLKINELVGFRSEKYQIVI